MNPAPISRIGTSLSDLLAARSQMAMSLAFHIVFAVAGIGMPLLMSVSEWKWMRTRDAIYKELTKRWAKGTAVMFAVGAVSGTVLSFELGLLWPEFMRLAGPVIGMPFSLEGFAFFLEAIFLGIYLYGWDRVSEKAHFASGLMVCLSGTLSGVFVVCANAWMNSPAGFDIVHGEFVNIRPFEAMFNPMAFQQALHMTIAAFSALSIAVVGIHAWQLLKNPDSNFHQAALKVALPVAFVSSLLQPLSGDLSAKAVAKYQPIKFAAMEAHFDDEKGAPLHLGGWPDEEAGKTRFAIKIPYMLSILAFGDPEAEVKGLNSFPRSEWPPVAPVHIAFQIMVGCGVMMLLSTSIAVGFWRKRKRLDLPPSVLKLLAFCGPLGIIAVQAGWIVTEVGRQPWIVYQIMRVDEAVTPMPGLIVPFLLFTTLYFFLSWVVIETFRRLLKDAEFQGAGS